MKPAMPPNEEERIKALHAYHVLDTESEQQFDDIVLMASRICEAPIAMISLVDEHRQWFKSKLGMSLNETKRDIAFCAQGILQAEVMVIPDAQKDERFATNPLVVGNPKIRFYAGAPLVTPEGHALGMICVNDKVPRELKPEQIEALQALSRQVVAQLQLRRMTVELRQNIETLEQSQEELLRRTAFFEAVVNSPLDGILVVDAKGKKILQNQRMIDLWEIPEAIHKEKEDQKQLEWITNKIKNPETFLSKIRDLYTNREFVSRDQIELKDGTILDRYSSPVVGKSGKYFGRIWSFRDVTEDLRRGELLKLLGSAVEQAKESILITDAQLNLPGPKILFVNPAFTKMTGYTNEEVLGKTPRILQGPQTDRTLLEALRGNLERGEIFEGETVNYRKDGTAFDIEWQIAPIRGPHGKISHFVAIQRDVTERKEMEARMFQAQKMETVGRLAGGVAHEFNSILTAIIGQSEFLLNDLPAGGVLHKSAREIDLAANRAATLTRQLLAYGRKQLLKPETIDLDQLLGQMQGTLRHLMGKEIDVQMVTCQERTTVKMDPGQLEQVIVNLAMNAADAMPNGGRITFETSRVVLDEDMLISIPGLKPGGYVMLAVTDTGTGMTDDVKARLFEPFFSTKSVGRGTGLGLATAFGIIKQSEGHINVYSEMARGTSFKIYLPQVEMEQSEVNPRSKLPDLPGGTETILLAEDDPSLLEMASALLRRLGYTVLTAVDGIEALTLKQKSNIGHIDLLLTDLVMPHMSGKELSERIRIIYPRTKILFTSAYTENAMIHQGILGEEVTLLQKPFTPSTLARKIREVLDRPNLDKK